MRKPKLIRIDLAQWQIAKLTPLFDRVHKQASLPPKPDTRGMIVAQAHRPGEVRAWGERKEEGEND